MSRIVGLLCSACSRRFGGDETLRRHRFIAGDRYACRSDVDLVSRGFYRDRWGTWHRGSGPVQESLLAPTETDREVSPLPDPTRPMLGQFHRDGHDTEVAAAVQVAPRTGTQRAAVLREFQGAGSHGLTDYELGVLLGMFRWVAGTRRGELIRDGWPIEDSGDRRKTDTGTKAIVWRLRA